VPTLQTLTTRFIRVIDGDTLEINLHGMREEMRSIGVDTPETRHPQKPVQPFGPEAAEAHRPFVGGQTVRLAFDFQRRDRYGRLRAYVSVGNMMVNAELMRPGYAQVATFPPNVKYQDLFLTLQREAREAKRGLWGQ
jgi:micrococcal nuclease